MKVRDVVGLYVDPPDHAVVISVDESEAVNAIGSSERANQIQALGRTQTPLPMKAGHPETRTHDDTGNGTTCLMAALDVATGKVTGQMVERHRSEEFLAFLDLVSEGIKPGTPVHVILDKVSSQKSAEVNQWLKDHAGLVVPFHPDLCLLDERRRGLLLPGSRSRGSSTRSSIRSTSASRRSRATSSITTPLMPALSAGARKPEDLVEAWKDGAPEAAGIGIVKRNQATNILETRNATKTFGGLRGG